MPQGMQHNCYWPRTKVAIAEETSQVPWNHDCTCQAKRNDNFNIDKLQKALPVYLVLSYLFPPTDFYDRSNWIELQRESSEAVMKVGKKH